MSTRAQTVGSVALDFIVDTNSLIQAINSAARSAGTQFTNTFQQSLGGVSQSVNQLTSSVQNSMNSMTQSVTNTMRSSAAQMSSQMQAQMGQMSQNLANAVRNSNQQILQNSTGNIAQISQQINQAGAGATSTVQSVSDRIQAILNDTSLSERSKVARIAALYRQQGMDMSTSMTRAWSLVRNGANNTSQVVQNSTNNITQNINNINNAAQNTANTMGGTLTNAIKSVGKAIFAAFSVRYIIRFTKSCVEAAAQVKALNAQLEQTFNVLQTDALKAIQKVATESGILETRLQGVGTQIYAFAKASGMDSTTALNMMQEALQVTADSAAYYDRSIEDTAESLRSFLKGNFANDAALGISCTQTTRNIAANKLFGKSYKELSEAQKQLTLLQMVKDANKLSGAMGQAAREADGWENVTGNLKEAWKQLKAAIGQPLLQALIPVIKNITSAIQTLTKSVQQAAQSLAALFGWDLSSAQAAGNAITSVADDIADAEDEAQEEIDETEKKQSKSLAKFDDLNILSSNDNGNDGDTKSDNGVNAIGTADSVREAVNELNNTLNSIDIGSVKDKFQSVITVFEPLAQAVKNDIEAVTSTSQQTLSKYLEKYGNKINSYAQRIKDNVTNTVKQTSSGTANILNEAAKSQESMSDKLSTGFADLLGGTSAFSLSFTDVFTDMFDISSENFEQWTVDNSALLGDFFDGINENIANFSTTFGGILDGIGTTLTDWWDNTGSQAFDNLSQAFADVKTVLLDFWTNYISPFIDYVITSVGELWDNHLSKLWNGILELVSSVMDTVSAIWNGLLRPIYDTFIKRIMPSIMAAIKSIWDIICDVVGMVIDVVRGAIRSAQGLLDFITGIFTGDLEKCAKGFAEFVHGICIAIWGVIKGVLNVIIDALNTVWSAFYGVVKSIVDGIGDFVSLIGDMFGQSWGFSMPEEPPRIPRLASGGLVKAPTLALVGDNKNARSDPEVISPLSKLQGMIDAENSTDTEVLQQILTYLKMVYDECRNIGDITVTEEMDGERLFKWLIRKNNKYKNSHNGKGAFA